MRLCKKDPALSVETSVTHCPRGGGGFSLTMLVSTYSLALAMWEVCREAGVFFMRRCLATISTSSIARVLHWRTRVCEAMKTRKDEQIIALHCGKSWCHQGEAMKQKGQTNYLPGQHDEASQPFSRTSVYLLQPLINSSL